MANYIFGYGSLINSASRQLTGQTSVAIPAIAHGLQRYWGKIDDSYVLSPLVVNPGKGLVNGVLLEVTETQLKEFDIRERGYHRITITVANIDCHYSLSPHDDIWVYINNDIKPPCSGSPIMQSYLDTVLVGCLEISEQFATQFIEHTLGWQFPIENDRHQPKYGHLAGVTPQHHAMIDALVAKVRKY